MNEIFDPELELKALHKARDMQDAMTDEFLTCKQCGHNLLDRVTGCSCVCHFREDRVTPL